MNESKGGTVAVVFLSLAGVLGLVAIFYGSGDSLESWMPTIIRAIIFNLLIVGAALTYDRMSRRPKRRLCRRCGYDVTAGAPTKCPRCGHPTPVP